MASENVAASVKDRLRNISKQRQEDFNQILSRYVSERFLYRLSQSEIRDSFVLKGASVFQIWQGDPHRPTKDIDLLGYGTNDPNVLKSSFEKVCRIPCEDGIEFTTVSAQPIQLNQLYQGVRLKIQGFLGTAKLNVQIDVGYGHVVTPAPQTAQFPTLLDQPAPVLKTYPRETVLAEKFQAIVALGTDNTRVKDYYDIYFLAKNDQFDGELIKRAFQATFERRQTALPTELPPGLSPGFANTVKKVNQWNKILDTGFLDSRPSLSEAVTDIGEFLMPPSRAAAFDSPFNQLWSPTQQWQEQLSSAQEPSHILYKRYSKDAKQGLLGDREIASRALRDGVAREAVVEILASYSSAYRNLVARAGEEVAEKAIIERAEVEIVQRQTDQSQSVENRQSRGRRPGT